MTEFSDDWLALREAADARARSRELVARLATALHGPLRCVDLGAGTGANVRYLAARLAGPQHWELRDHDADLLACARGACSALHAADGRAVTVTTAVTDLFDWAGTGWRDAQLVTASALLDLMGGQWIRSLVGEVAAADAAALLALSYDGRIGWEPGDAADDALRTAFNAHQRARWVNDEPALGPDAGAAAASAFRDAGFRVHAATSDWCIGGDQPRLLQALIAGWVEAAAEQQPDDAGAFRAWGERRSAQVERCALRVRVGHTDCLALPRREG